MPRDWIVESKSLKLFLASFRNHGAFHEACTMQIAERLVALLDPVWLRIGAYWFPRGGNPDRRILADGAPPEGAWIPAQDVPPIAAGDEKCRPTRAAALIRDRALALGFDAVGFCRAELGPEARERLSEFLQAGQHGDMGWLAGRAEQRSHPRALWPEARSVIALGLSYAPEDDPLWVA